MVDNDGVKPQPDVSPAQPLESSKLKRWFQSTGRRLRAVKERISAWLLTSMTSLAYRLLTSAFIALLLSTGLWFFVLTVSAVEQERITSWNSLWQALGGTAVVAAAGWLVRTLPPLQAKDDIAGQQRFMVMCLAGTFLFLWGEYQLWRDGRLPATIAPAALADQVNELRNKVEQNQKNLTIAAGYLDAYSDTWQRVPADVRRWKRIPALAKVRYRLDLKPESTIPGASFEVVVVDDKGALLIGRRVMGLNPVRLYAETGDTTRSLTIGVLWRGAENDSAAARQGPPELSLNVTVLRTEAEEVPLVLDDQAKTVTLETRVESLDSSLEGHSRFDTGTCGGGKQPDRSFRVAVKEAGWAKVALSSRLPAALYLLRQRPGDDKKGLMARELACDDSEQADPQPGRALAWRSQFELALNPGTYLVVADSKEGPANAAIEFSQASFNSASQVVAADGLPTEVMVDLLGRSSAVGCGGANEVFQDIMLTGEGPFLAAISKSPVSVVLRTPGASGTIPFSTDASVVASWFREKQPPSKRCSNTFVSEPTDSVLRVHLKDGEPPPRVKVRLRRALREEERSRQMEEACKNALELKPGATSTIPLDKDDRFAVQVPLNGPGKVVLTADALGVGAADAVRKVTVERAGDISLQLRANGSSGNFVAYLLQTCTANEVPLFLDQGMGGFSMTLQGAVRAGDYFLVVDGAEAGDRGELSATLKVPTLKVP